MCPIVPTFTCGFDRSNFSLPMTSILLWSSYQNARSYSKFFRDRSRLQLLRPISLRSSWPLESENPASVELQIGRSLSSQLPTTFRFHPRKFETVSVVRLAYYLSLSSLPCTLAIISSDTDRGASSYCLNCME